MKRETKIVAIITLSLCMIFVGNLTKAEAATATKASLTKKIKSQTGEAIAKKYYADFDGNGEKELFVITGGKEGPNHIWYASSKQVKCLNQNDTLAVYYTGAKGVYTVSKKQKLFIVECGAFGSGSFSRCYYVKAGKVHEVKKAGERLTQISGRNFAVYQSAFDRMYSGNFMCGHTYKAYYIKWTGKNFKEYKAKKISVSKLKKYRGSDKVLRQIKKLGYKVKSVYYRSNGLIHINVVKASGSDRVYNNVTLKVKAKKVSVAVCNKKGHNIVEKSGYGGIYKASGF